MSDFVIDPSIISWKELVKQLKAFLQSKPDESAWKDFYDCGAGTTLIELIAGYSAFSKRDLIANRRENYLFSAKNISTVIGIAESNSYSAFRGRNCHVRLKIIPSSTRGLTKFQIIGNVKNIDLVCLDNYSLIAGQAITIDCVIGNLTNLTVSASNDSLQVFRFLQENISEDFILKIDNLTVPTSTEVIDLLNDKYVTLTNYFGGVDCYYLNQGDYNYIALTNISLDYIELNNLTFDFPNDIIFLYGTIQPTVGSPATDDTQILNFYIVPETIDSIKIKAPLKYETQKVIRGREDFRKIFLLLNPDFIDTSADDVSPALVELTYLKNDLTTLTNLEKQNYIKLLNDYTLYGVKYKDMSDPVKVTYSLKLSLKAHPNQDLSNIASKITEIFSYVHEIGKEIILENRISRREKKFKHELDLEAIEHEFDRLPEIKISRVELNSNFYQTNHIYKRGDFIKATPDNGKIYECIKAGLSSNTQPIWTLTENELLIESISEWQLNTAYNVDDIIVSSPPNGRAYICMQNGTSDTFQPTWNVDLNDLNIDGTTLWKCINILDVDKVIWKCLNPNVKNLPTNWNEFIILDYGVGIIWL